MAATTATTNSTPRHCAAIMPAIALLLATACGFPRPADVPEDGDDHDAATLCTPNTDACSANSASTLDHCGPDGRPTTSETCAVACVATPSAHCAYLEPRYLPDVCDAVATLPAFTVSTFATFDTGLDSNCTGGLVDQVGGPPICVVRYGSIRIAPTGILTLVGPRALALVADTTVIVDGVLDLSASGAGSGPGGGTVASGDKVTIDGGGGAGFATQGGAGGSATTDGGGGRGGGRATDPSIVTVLLGGTRANPSFGGAPSSGGAGGAATLIACRGHLSLGGVIDAAGGGGSGGGPGNTMFSTFAGAGGGSGGSVVLQGLSITVTGQIFANGGGGGAGFVPGGPRGQPGSDGARSATEAAAGGTALAGEGAGGSGGRQGVVPGVGLHPTVANALPGGGGGSTGFFQTYTPMSVTPALTPTAASPVFSPHKVVETR